MHETSLIDYALNAVEARAAQMGIEASIIQKNGGLKITTQHGGGADW